jgi:NADH-quinone oxidoreductase subunit N
MYPIILLSVTGLLTLFLGFSKNKSLLLPATLLSFGLALACNFLDWNHPGVYFNGMLEVDNSVIVIQSIIILSGLFIAGITSGQFDDTDSHPAEYYAIMQFAIVGAVMMVNFQNFLMLFLGLEILSVALYVLTGSDKRNLRGNEAAIKYFLMGSFATGILLFGVAMYYGGTGSFNLTASSMLAIALPESKVYFWIGMLFILVGLLFKVSAAPFHFWTADVYQGAPSIFTAFMATVVKTAGFFAIYRVIHFAFQGQAEIWTNILNVAIVLSLIIGNLTAVFQSNFKRMLAYSSISQAGFMLLSIVGIGSHSVGSLAFYSMSYALATIVAFGVLVLVSTHHIEAGRPNEEIATFNGLFKKSPTLAITLLIAMLSLSGIPITAGFWAKFFVLNDAASKSYLWLLVLAVVMSAISIYYYFKPIRAAFKTDSEHTETIVVPALTKWILLVCTALMIVFGVAPQLFKNLI